MTLTPTTHPIKAMRPCAHPDLKFSSSVSHVEAAAIASDAPSAKLNINISAFNGNKTNFGKK